MRLVCHVVIAGAIIVNEWSQTSISSIYAIGDATDRLNLTPVAIAEGHAFADSLYGGCKRTVDHANVASAVFSQPPIASVGMTEANAIAAGRQVTVFESQFRAMKNTISGRDEDLYETDCRCQNRPCIGCSHVGA